MFFYSRQPELLGREQITCGCIGRLWYQRRFLSRKTALHNSSGPQELVIGSNFDYGDFHASQDSKCIPGKYS